VLATQEPDRVGLGFAQEGRRLHSGRDGAGGGRQGAAPCSSPRVGAASASAALHQHRHRHWQQAQPRSPTRDQGSGGIGAYRLTDFVPTGMVSEHLGAGAFNLSDLNMLMLEQVSRSIVDAAAQTPVGWLCWILGRKILACIRMATG
jgi:hypothetical protein